MAIKVVVGQPEKPNASTVAARDAALESGDKHIQNVADLTLMTSAEVAALVNPTISDHATRITDLETDIYQWHGPGGVEYNNGPLQPDAFIAHNSADGTVRGRYPQDFAAKASPSTSDVMLVGDAAASGVPKNITLLQLATLLGQTSWANPYLAKPASPNAFDDEFDQGSPDLAARGYTVVNANTGAVLTRPAGNAGNVNPWDATGPAAGTYWSQIVGTWLYIQGAPGLQIDIYKTITLAAGETYYARTVGSYCLMPAANGRFCEIGFYGASGAQVDNNNRVFSTVRDDTMVNFLALDAFRSTAGVQSGGTRYMHGGHDIRGVRFDSGTTHCILVVDSQNGQPKSLTVTGAPAAGTLTRFGLRNLFSTSGGVVPQLWAIDFIRKKTGNAWLVP